MSLLWPASIIADDSAELKAAAEFWRALEPIGLQYVISFERDDNSGLLYERGELIRDGNFSIYTSELANRSREIAFTNPNYYAMVRQRPSTKIWKEKHFETDTSDAIFQHIFFMQVINPGSIREALSSDNVAKRIELLPEKTGIAVEFKDSLPKGSTVHPDYAGAQLRVFAINSFPTKIELVQNNDHGGMATRLEYHDFVDQQGTRLPRRVIASFFHTANGQAYDTNVYRYTYSAFKPIDQKRCSLAYYGLNEPDSIKAR